MGWLVSLPSQQQDFDLAPGLALAPEQTGRQHFGLVDDQAVFRPQELQDITKITVLVGARLAIQNQKSRMISFR